jgi:hypothetical protein
MAFFSFSLSEFVTFLPEVVIVGFPNFEQGFMFKKKIWGGKKCEGPLLPPGFKKKSILKTQKCLEFYQKMPKSFRWCLWGAEQKA